MRKKLEEYGDAELYYLMQSDKSISEKCFAELYNRLSPRIYAYCRRFLGDSENAKDVFQETFVRFFQSSSKERDMTNLPAFVLKIARNLCVNAKRKEKPTVLLEDYMAVHHDNRNDRDELLNLIKMALELLPEDYKEAFILREYEGLSYSDIAEMTDTPLSSVKIRIFRAKQRIREILQPYMSDLTSI